MKSRVGFVSNSSSSSFVIVGVKLTDKQYNKLTEKEDELLDSEDYLSDDGPGYVGKVIADTDGTDCLEVGELDIDKAVKEATEIIEKHGLNKDKIKIHFGTRAC